MSNQTKGLAALLAAHGRHGDTELLHVSKDELRALDALGSPLGIELTTNPQTGLKEAFNWGSTIGGVLGGVAGTFAAPFTAGVINPYTGAALGAAAGSKLSGKSNEEALMNGAIAGVTAWGLGGASDALGSLGQEATKETVNATVQEGGKTLAQEGVGNLAQTTAPNAFNSVTQNGLSNLYNPSTATSLAPQTTALPGGPLANFSQTGGDLAKSFVSTSTPVQLGGETLNIPNSAVQNAAKPDFANTLAKSGTTGQYWSNVGKGLESLNTPGKAGEFILQNKGSLLAGGLGAYALGSGAGNTGDTSTSTMPTSTSNYYGETYYTPYGERRTRAVPYAQGGGISSLGSYSDGGQLLRGPGDGVSDSIPASIEDHQPARLAEGEFVIPARAVSELGNGSTEAGSKQLYAMLNRIAKKRKKGKGLAYDANPQKLLPA